MAEEPLANSDLLIEIIKTKMPLANTKITLFAICQIFIWSGLLERVFQKVSLVYCYKPFMK